MSDLMVHRAKRNSKAFDSAQFLGLQFVREGNVNGYAVLAEDVL